MTQSNQVEPWSMVFTDVDDGAILDVVNGRRGATVKAWLGGAAAVVAPARSGRRPRHVQ